MRKARYTMVITNDIGMHEKLFVSISSPEKIVWEGEADALTSENSKGSFDVLPGHANFITIIEKKPIIVRRIDGEKEFTFPTAILYVRANNVTVYTNI